MKLQLRPKKEEKPENLYPVVGASGKVEWCNPDGEKVSFKSDYQPLEKFNENKFDLFCQLLSEGRPMSNALTQAKISKSSLILWKKGNPALDIEINSALSLRNDLLQEKVYADEIISLTQQQIMSLDLSKAAVVEKRLKLLRAKQNIMQNFTMRNHNKVNPLEEQVHASVRPSQITIKAETIQLLEQNFSPRRVSGKVFAMPGPSGSAQALEEELIKIDRENNKTNNGVDGQDLSFTNPLKNPGENHGPGEYEIRGQSNFGRQRQGPDPQSNEDEEYSHTIHPTVIDQGHPRV